jgi:hypothetical protein
MEGLTKNQIAFGTLFRLFGIDMIGGRSYVLKPENLPPLSESEKCGAPILDNSSISSSRILTLVMPSIQLVCLPSKQKRN